MTSGNVRGALAGAGTTAGTTVWPRLLASSALAGAASGARSATGVAALTLAARADTRTLPDRVLARPWVKAVAGVLAAQEFVADKLPAAPSRLEPPGLAARLAGAGLSGVVIARRAPRARLPGPGSRARVPGPDEVPAAAGQPDRLGPPARIIACAVTSMAAAAATAWLGARWRGWASDRLGQDWLGAGIEDAAALALAATAAFGHGAAGSAKLTRWAGPG
jgi:uncharacterized membrane protein